MIANCLLLLAPVLLARADVDKATDDASLSSFSDLRRSSSLRVFSAPFSCIMSCIAVFQIASCLVVEDEVVARERHSERSRRRSALTSAHYLLAEV